MSAPVLYDLAGADDACRFSPYCWRAKLALAHKGLAFETVPVRFTDKALIAFSGQGKVPVLRDRDTIVADSWAIARHLDATAGGPALFGQDGPEGSTAFIRHWADRVLHAAIAPLLILDIHARLAPGDQAYFRTSREALFGRSLEAVAAGAGEARAHLRKTLAPLRATLLEQAFVAGAAPAFSDYVVFGAFQWARVTRPADVLDDDPAIHAWRERMLDLFGGLARAQPAAS